MKATATPHPPTSPISIQRGQEGNGADPFTADLSALLPALAARARFLTQDASRADDLVQETIERALLHRGSFRTGTNLRAWTTSIMRNLFIDDRRRVVPYVYCDQDVASDSSDAVDDPLDYLSLSDVKEAISALPTKTADILEAALLSHLSYRELSARFQVSQTTAGCRLFRAKLRLRAELECLFRSRVAARMSPPETSLSD